MERPAVPAALARRLFEEAGYRCAIPTCRSTSVLEKAHIIPWSEVREHSFENMIILCRQCHGLFDIEKKIPRSAILAYKANLGLLTHRYNETERRVLDFFLNPENPELLVTSVDSFMMQNLIDDGHLIAIPGKVQSKLEIDSQTYYVPHTWIYQLTPSGAQLLRSYIEALYIN